MDMILSIISSIGINETLFIHLGMYLFAFVVLYVLVFNPYYRFSEQRRTLTSGSFESVEKMEKQIRKNEEIYQTRARQINEEISLIFRDQRNEAHRESDKIVSEAQDHSKDLAQQSKQQLVSQMHQAQEQIGVISKDVSVAIVQRILDRRGKSL